ncbi:MAG: hypothetical protein ABR570_06435 [Burkholderiales bacterium]
MLVRLIAAAIALSATFSLVWGVASLAYPPRAQAAPLVLAQACR